MFAENGFTVILASETVLTRNMTETVLKNFLNNRKLFVTESGNHQNAAEMQVLSGQRHSIIQIRIMFLRSSMAATSQLRTPAATNEKVNDSAPLQGPPTGDANNSTAPQQHGDSESSENVVTVAPEEKVNEAGDVVAILANFSANNLCNRSQQVDVSYNKENRDSKENETPRLTKRRRQRAPLDASQTAIAIGDAFQYPLHGPSVGLMIAFQPFTCWNCSVTVCALKYTTKIVSVGLSTSSGFQGFSIRTR